MEVITTETFLQQKNTRSTQLDVQLDDVVQEIIREVREKGDRALYDYTEAFDSVNLENLIVSEREFKEANDLVTDDFLSALIQAKSNIKDFHEAQKEKSWFYTKPDGIMLGQKVTPLERVGVYIPGGKAAYPSTALMNIIPAQLAGVEEIVITTPPQPNGKVNPYVLAAANELGIQTVYKIGGAQAIAALAYGTETIKKVAKIVGPGNAYVARAKKWVYGDVAIDMIAGPSEICIFADKSAPPSYIAADLLSQAEHDESATSICITSDREVANKVNSEIEKQVQQLERKDIIQKSLELNGRIILVNDLSEGFELINSIAPEHLQLMIENPMDNLHAIKHAGAIFLGNYSPEPLGDYFAGPNHTLPTNGTAKFSSPLGVYDFVKRSSIINYSSSALDKATNSIIKLANTEGLTAHANSIEIRKGKR
ncbi:histidinol dehydrogenase [Virgibacillus halodenitrificans]|uniref:Histidinol dehydrogenase n=1 Tax=Virgibacillus halodenitrificans TaxID=1482 RepID=A0AAC9NJH8_VIRHA|nr:histidinol dehydrogenase [Virgibacillus halodenitrificans]APC47033.1 histidinol dehydrogenase [Virgibacillus halodenitrificans]MCG1027367.1 histidinol dehydrogenase [Virgibacillus halodenitrificans]MYL46853.1 histidinol dehydrogenase [Virgibacillus halodenitrificans]